MHEQVPPGWNKGELLDVRNLGMRIEVRRIYPQEEREQPLTFESVEDAQNFISWWYMR